MALELTQEQGGKVFAVRISGRLTAEDYERFVPEVEAAIRQHGKIRVLLELHDFHGWDAGALWQDIKFDLHHFRDIERLAIVGETRWQEGMATFCKPFTTAAIRYFTHDQLAEARAWIAAA
jgi:hypothetical protein